MPRPSRQAAPMAVVGLAALAGLALLVPPGTQAHAAPGVVAGVLASDALVFSVEVPASEAVRPITVELLDGKKVLTRTTYRVPAGPATQVPVRFDKFKRKLTGLSVRSTLGDQSRTVPIEDVLLLKANETSVSGSADLHAGSKTELTCTVQGVRSLTKTIPLLANVELRLLAPGKGAPMVLHRGKTDAEGKAKLAITVPEVPPGNYTLELVTKSALGNDRLTRQVRILSSPKILLTCDKPLYQPGQTMHLRAMALQTFDLRPLAGQNLVLEIEDAKGNKVCKKELTTSKFGIASTDFTLADEVNMGEYRLRALLGTQSAEKTVTVKKYVLPKFKVALKTDRTFYLPKETIKGSLQVDYFFGKPVAGGKVEIKASTFDVAFKDFQTFTGTTNASGHVDFEIRLPDYFVGTPLASGNALVKLETKVTDTADHTENQTRTLPVSDQAVRINVLPEGGRLIPGIENRILVAATYPDGSPAECSVEVFVGTKVEGKPHASIKTASNGLTEFRLIPAKEKLRQGQGGQVTFEMLGGQVTTWGVNNLFDLALRASDRAGNKAQTTAALTSEPLGDNVLLRLDRAIYKGGETVNAEIHTTAGLPTVYLDVVKEGQTLLTRWLDVEKGKAVAKLDLPASVFGTIELHAYQVLASGEVIRDSRIVYVNPASGLTIKAIPDRAVYQPGAMGKIAFEVTDSRGNPTAAALGVLIVDEAVYALQEIQPGLEKVFFTLQQEMLKPSVQVNYKPGEPLEALIRQSEVPADKQQAAQALLSMVRAKVPGRWQVNPKIQRQNALEQHIFALSMSTFDAAREGVPVLEIDRASGKPRFTKDLFKRLLRTNRITSAWLDNGMGGKLTLEEVMAVEPKFSPDTLAVSVTQAIVHNLCYQIIYLATLAGDRWKIDGKQVFPEDAIIRAAKAVDLSSKDAWGRPLKLLPWPKGKKNTTGNAILDTVSITSAGPDGKFGTPDDIVFSKLDSWSLREQWLNPERGWWRQNSLAWRNWHGGMAQGIGGLMGGDGPGLGGGGLAGGFQLGLQGGLAGGLQGGFFAGGGGFGNAGGMPMGGGGGGTTPAAMPGMAPRAAIADSGATQAPMLRMREYFPETLLWQPALITDDQGKALLEVPFADSITTWRMSASGSSVAGMLGGMSAPLKVFQDFFVDLDLPVALTQNDEIAFPVAVYNYLKTPQTVTLDLKPEPWFELLDVGGTQRKLTLEAGQVTAIKYRIRAKKVGIFPLTVEARGTKLSDAIKRTIEVIPDGKAFEQIHTDRLEGPATHTVTIPPAAIDGASRLYVKVYPGVLSQVVEGLEGMLQMPGGCFEQTSSSAYPNLLIIDYIKKARLGSPALLARSEQLLSAGYQRLLTFERPGGGFDWWGSGEPLVWLSAYGLQEFNDMARVYPVDPGVIARTQAWLLKQQAADGTWSNIGATHGELMERMGDSKLLLTSYVTWALLDSMPRTATWRKSPEYARLQKAIAYIREQAPKANNAYILALAANALASWDKKDDSTFEVLKRVIKKLDELKERKAEINGVYFPAQGQSLAYGRDDGLIIETTALAILAMVKNGEFTSTVNQALTYLVKTKGSGGHWGSTQGTILALKALLAGMSGGTHKGTTPFTVSVGGKEVARGEVTDKNSDVLQLFDLTAHLKTGDNEVKIGVGGKTPLMYQVVGRHFEPFAKTPEKEKPILEVDVAYDRTRLSTSDLLKAAATVKYHGKTPTYNVIVDLPIPPGFTVNAGDFAELVAAKKVQKFSVTARQVILYLGDVKSGETYSFPYALKPKYPIKAKTAPAVVYEYYTPRNRAIARPVELIVEEKK